MLIVVLEHSTRDQEHWRRLEVWDLRLASSSVLARMEDRALGEIEKFRARQSCFVGVSWGKDSTVLAHLNLRLADPLPMACVLMRPLDNPLNGLVRDKFGSMFQGCMDYYEQTMDATINEQGGWHYKMFEPGVPGPEKFLGVDGRITGIRAQESGMRKARARRWGVSSDLSCCPLIWWESQWIWAYLAKYDLPVHPQYAMTFGGTLDRSRLRVNIFGMWQAQLFGGDVQEDRYYPKATEIMLHPRPLEPMSDDQRWKQIWKKEVIPMYREGDTR